MRAACRLSSNSRLRYEVLEVIHIGFGLVSAGRAEKIAEIIAYG